MTSLSFDQKLNNLAELAVKVGVNLQPGQRFIIRAPLDSAPLVRLIAAKAYQSGARLVDVNWTDDGLTLARFEHAPRDSFEEYPIWVAAGLNEVAQTGGAVLSIVGNDPDLLKDQDPDLVALVQKLHRTHLGPFYSQLMKDGLNWSIISHPAPAWAAKVFPAGTPEQQLANLWEAIFRITRADQPDPVAAWQAHTANLAHRRDILTAKQYTALHYRAPGTDLTLGLPENHVWHGGAKDTLTGVPFIPNMPTEEVFSMPHRDRVDGVVSSSLPLSYAGVLIDDISLRFENGRVAHVSAKRGEATLKKLIDTDEGAARLGEVALVPHSSPIAQSGLLFYNTLFDENAANHLALGRAYRFCVQAGPAMTDDEFAAAGGNNSLTHVDFMIGSAQMDIDGVLPDGSVEPLMRAGEWAD